MNHYTSADFWACYNQLPAAVRTVADENYRLLLRDPRHPSLHFKQVGRLWSIRAGRGYRALAVDSEQGLIWFWIGPHAEYERIIKRR